MPLFFVSWKKVDPVLYYCYAKTVCSHRQPRREMGWIWVNDGIYHCFSNDGGLDGCGDLGDYTSLDAAQKACETFWGIRSLVP